MPVRRTWISTSLMLMCGIGASSSQRPSVACFLTRACMVFMVSSNRSGCRQVIGWASRLSLLVRGTWRLRQLAAVFLFQPLASALAQSPTGDGIFLTDIQYFVVAADEA